MSNKKILALFDVDDTLTAPRKSVTPEMKEFIGQLRTKVTVGVVGGSDLVKQKEQLGNTIIQDVDYSFSENGLVAYKSGVLIGKEVRLLSGITYGQTCLTCCAVCRRSIPSSVRRTSKPWLISLLDTLQIWTFLSRGTFSGRLLSKTVVTTVSLHRGTFIEFRSGMLNISPIGRNCSQTERDEYEKFDLVRTYAC
jgi:phosphomannomutase